MNEEDEKRMAALMHEIHHACSPYGFDGHQVIDNNLIIFSIYRGDKITGLIELGYYMPE